MRLGIKYLEFVEMNLVECVSEIVAVKQFTHVAADIEFIVVSRIDSGEKQGAAAAYTTGVKGWWLGICMLYN